MHLLVYFWYIYYYFKFLLVKMMYGNNVKEHLNYLKLRDCVFSYRDAIVVSLLKNDDKTKRILEKNRSTFQNSSFGRYVDDIYPFQYYSIYYINAEGIIKRGIVPQYVFLRSN